MRVKFFITYNIGEAKIAAVDITCDDWEGDVVREAHDIVENGAYIPDQDTVISPSCIQKVSWDRKQVRRNYDEEHGR